MRDFTYPPVVVAAKALFRVLGTSFQVTGLENIPSTGGAVLASNHIGYVDWLYDGFAAQRRGRFVRYMAKKEAFEGALGPVMKSFHHIPVDRANGEGALHQAVAHCRAGEVVGIFPEATISRSFEIKECKTGAARIAAEAGVPLIPMVTWGTQLLKTKDHEPDLWARGRTIALHVGRPVETSDDALADTAALKAALESLLHKAVADYPLRPDGQWWAPARLGGTAPTPEEAAKLDAEELAARAARKAAKRQLGS